MPTNCQSDIAAETRIEASGEYRELPPGSFVWVLAYARENQLYYPQSPNAEIGAIAQQENGSWSVPLYLGRPDSQPEWFDIVIVFTDEQTSNYLSDWVRSGYPNNYSGISPDELRTHNITEKTNISVQTYN